MGLTANDTIAYKYPTTTLPLLKSANKTDIVFKPMTTCLLTYPNDDLTIRAVNRELKELVDEKDFKRYFDNKVKIIEEKNKQIEKQLSEERDKQLILHKITRAFKENRAFTKKFIDLHNNTILYVHAFKQTMTRYGPTFLLLCSTKPFIISSINLHIYWATSNVNKYIGKLWTNGNYHDLYLNECDAYGTHSGESFLTLCKKEHL